MVNEEEYEMHNIPPDVNFNGEAVPRDMTIALENRQRAKVLSSLVQIEARNAIIMNKKKSHYRKQLFLYKKESSVYELNAKCERKLVELVAINGNSWQ